MLIRLVVSNINQRPLDDPLHRLCRRLLDAIARLDHHFRTFGKAVEFVVRRSRFSLGN